MRNYKKEVEESKQEQIVQGLKNKLGISDEEARAELPQYIEKMKATNGAKIATSGQRHKYGLLGLYTTLASVGGFLGLGSVAGAPRVGSGLAIASITATTVATLHAIGSDKREKRGTEKAIEMDLGIKLTKPRRFFGRNKTGLRPTCG